MTIEIPLQIANSLSSVLSDHFAKKETPYIVTNLNKQIPETTIDEAALILGKAANGYGPQKVNQNQLSALHQIALAIKSEQLINGVQLLLNNSSAFFDISLSFFTEEEADFTFDFKGKATKCTKANAAMISRKAISLINNEVYIAELEFPEDLNDGDCLRAFSRILNLFIGGTIELTKENRLLYRKIAELIDFPELIEACNQCFLLIPTQIDQIPLTEVAERFGILEQTSLKLIKPDNMKKILEHTIKIPNEDYLLLFLMDYCKIWGEESSCLFSAVNFQNISEPFLSEFSKTFTVDLTKLKSNHPIHRKYYTSEEIVRSIPHIECDNLFSKTDKYEITASSSYDDTSCFEPNNLVEFSKIGIWCSDYGEKQYFEVTLNENYFMLYKISFLASKKLFPKSFSVYGSDGITPYVELMKVENGYTKSDECSVLEFEVLSNTLYRKFKIQANNESYGREQLFGLFGLKMVGFLCDGY